MRVVLYKFSIAVLGSGLAAAFVAVFLPVNPGLVLDLYLLFLGAVGLLALVRMTRVAQPGSSRSPFEDALRPRKRPAERPPELVRLEEQLALAATTAFDVHFRLRPVVREIAAQRVWSKRAVDFQQEPERARPLVGPRVWELARPDRPAPDDPFAPGLGVRGLEAVVEELERT